MSRKVTKGVITGGILGATVVMYIMGKKLQERKEMKSKKRFIDRAATAMKGLSMF